MFSVIQIIKQTSSDTDMKFEDIWQMLYDYGYCDQYGNLTNEVIEFYNLK